MPRHLLVANDLHTGVVLQVQPVSPDSITENSTMTRNLCVELVSIGEGLERNFTADINFMPQGYSQSSEFNHM